MSIKDSEKEPFSKLANARRMYSFVVGVDDESDGGNELLVLRRGSVGVLVGVVGGVVEDEGL